MSKTLAEELGEFIAQPDFDSFSDETFRIATRCFVDGNATVLSGSTMPLL